MDTDVQAGDKGYALTKEKNIPLVIMEPLKGGVLANLPDEVSKEFKNAEPEAHDTDYYWLDRGYASIVPARPDQSAMDVIEEFKTRFE